MIKRLEDIAKICWSYGTLCAMYVCVSAFISGGFDPQLFTQIVITSSIWGFRCSFPPNVFPPVCTNIYLHRNNSQQGISYVAQKLIASESGLIRY